MNRGQAHGSGAYEPAQESYHHEIYDDGMQVQSENYRAGGPGKLRLLAHVTGTLLSLAVIGTGGYWGYKQIMRDVHGVPVVRALEGPMRVAPDDPGGQIASHSGLSVNGVQASGAASPPEERLTLAPAPVDLSEEDLPLGQLTASTKDGDLELASSAEADDAELLPPDESAQLASLSQEFPADDPIARAIALANASIAGATPLSEAETGAEPVEASAQDEALPEVRTVQVVTGPGVALSPRPLARPTSRAPVVLASVSATVSATPAVMDAAEVPKGTRLVQLGAFDTPEEARTAWGKISGKFDGLMVDKTQVVVEAKAGGRTFWRLRAMGFADLSDARRFCAALVAERTDCIPVVAK
ncbi:SPOR domain-containing protein [Aliiruegeria lutimaris]|uniref:Sporulation related domain-containing protein n=1 Tax=Aliiruegeria lutimaris TaxID=571298 RepID=A0A1G8LLP4_9RHOB|nr:SPOR domain-containing protein [Aliiruegeria lutimaris]SDI56140.1 Sporulation related domain-containing protein [Aliiruegeria lutimaris]